MILKELINMLEQADPTIVVPLGFHNPHSYRGRYDELAFSPMENVTVAEMLKCAREALGTIYQGYKGGDFMMYEVTECHLAFWGERGETIGPFLLKYMLGEIKSGHSANEQKSPEEKRNP